MMKDILVHIPTERSPQPVIDAAVSLARGAFRAERIGICWDGSHATARALKDALPSTRRNSRQCHP
jgi:hypothetical protein